MMKQRKPARRSGFSAALACAGAVLLVAAPTAGLALGALDSGAMSAVMSGTLGSFTPASVDPQLARLVGDDSGSDRRMMRFTPADSSNLSNRSVTVAVRVDGSAARLINSRQAFGSAGGADAQNRIASPRLVPTRYNLGVKRGYQSFAQSPVLLTELSDLAVPDLSSFKPSPGVKDGPSRFSARIELEEQDKTGRAPSTRDALGDQSLAVGGAYSLTRNIDVTAGVRYSQDRDRMAPVADGKQDSQAVYVGTQFRF